MAAILRSRQTFFYRLPEVIREVQYSSKLALEAEHFNKIALTFSDIF